MPFIFAQAEGVAAGQQAHRHAGVKYALKPSKPLQTDIHLINILPPCNKTLIPKKD